MLERAHVTSRAAGRHRGSPRGGQRRLPSLLLIDYPAGDGPLAPRPLAARPLARRSSRRRAGIRVVGRDGVLAVALSCLAGAVLVGIALSHSPGAAVGGNAAPGVPQPGSLLPQPGPASSSPAGAPDRGRRGAGPGHHHRVAAMQAQLKQISQASPSPAARQQAAGQPGVVVRYLVTSQGPAGFQGEIQVINNTAQPIGNWQIVVTLFDDAVTGFTNADGLFSNGILVLSPASPTQVAPPDGGVLDVFFAADGFQTTPEACAFDGVDCGY